MPLEFFVGPLCRYYSRDCRTEAVQPAARIGAGSHAEPDPSAEELLPAMLGWRRLITPQFRSAGVTSIDWNESPTAPVRSTPVDWARYWSLRLLAAYDESPSLGRPDNAPEDLGSDAGLRAIRDDFLHSRYPHLHACDFWLPLRSADPVTVKIPSEQTKPVGSVRMLRAELDQLHKRAFGAGTSGQLTAVGADPARTPLERQAAAALSLWLPLCDMAVEQRLPMVLDG